MRRWFFSFMLLFLMVPYLPARAQSGLTADQQILLNEILAAYQRRSQWKSYSQFSATKTTLAMTLTGTDTALWRTQNNLLETRSDRTNSAAKGSIVFESQAGESDKEPQSAKRTLQFIAIEDRVWVKNDQDADFSLVDPVDYKEVNLLALVDFSAKIDLAWFESATAIFDLGVKEAVQYYELELDFSASLPFIEFDLDGLLRQFDGLVEPETVANAITENARLRLQVGITLETGELASASILIESAAKIAGAEVVRVAAGDGVFQLDYAYQQETTYDHRNETFDITAP